MTDGGNIFGRLLQRPQASGAASIERPVEGASTSLLPFMPSRSEQLVQNPAVAGTGLDSRSLPARSTRQPRLAPRSSRQLLNFNHSELVVTLSSEFPDKLKIRKEIHAWPLRFKLRADYCRMSRAFEYGCSCKDALLGGRIRLDIPAQEIEYRKRVPMGGGHLGVTARASYAGALSGDPRSFSPSFSFAYELGGGTAIWAGQRFDLRHKFRVSRGLAIEVVGDAQLPTPAARYSWSRDAPAPAVHVGDGSLHLNIAQVNAVVNL